MRDVVKVFVAYPDGTSDRECIEYMAFLKEALAGDRAAKFAVKYVGSVMTGEDDPDHPDYEEAQDEEEAV